MSMFRLIALALVSTFSLLVLMGTVNERPTAMNPSGLMGASQAETTTVAAGGGASLGEAFGDVVVTTLGGTVRSEGASYVTASNARLREQPRPDAPVLAELASGAPVVLVEEGLADSPTADRHGGFVQVRSADGTVGYVDASLLHPV